MTEEILENAPQQRLLTVAEFAREIGKTERQVYRYIKNQRVRSLSPEETGMAGVRISSEELEKFLADNNSSSGSWRVRSGGIGSSFESFEDSVEGLAVNIGDGGTNLDENDEHYEAPTVPEVQLTVPLDRHEAAVMRLGYLQSQYEQTQRLLTEGSQKENQLNQKVAELQNELTQVQEKIRRIAELEDELAKAKQCSEDLLKKGNDQETQIAEYQEQAMRFRVKAEVEADNRAEIESRLRHLTVRLEEAERKAALPWWKKLFS